jgi:hypothetical protein
MVLNVCFARKYFKKVASVFFLGGKFTCNLFKNSAISSAATPEHQINLEMGHKGGICRLWRLECQSEKSERIRGFVECNANRIAMN